MESVRLFGIAIHDVTMHEVLETITGWLSGTERHYVTTPNVDHIVRLRKDPEFRAAYHQASLILADGMPIVWASRLLGTPLKERVAGSDLLPLVCQLAAEQGKTVFLLGGEHGAAKRAARNLTNRSPSLRVVGAYGPPRGFEADAAETQRITRLINGAKPDVLFVGLGAPKQEKWIARHIDQLDVKVALCVGASIEFVAGTLRRAPRWMQRVGLEWLWRLLQEPGRLWRRYLIEDMAFVPLFLKAWWHIRVTRGSRA